MSGHLSKMSKVSEVSDMTFSKRDGSLWLQGRGGGGLHFTSLHFTSLHFTCVANIGQYNISHPVHPTLQAHSIKHNITI